MGNSSNNPDSRLDGLLCLSSLQSALRHARDSDIRSREGIKELLAPAIGAFSVPKETASTADGDRWHHCLDVLVEDFLARKCEIGKLNKARRDRLEDFLRTQAGPSASLEDALRGKLGCPSQEALILFAHEAAMFHLFQILLVKRWIDQGQLDESALAPSQQTLNWIITGFLKKNSPKGMMRRHDWSFLKLNLFSWYTPAKDAWERVRRLLADVDLSLEPSDFPARVLEAVADRSRLSLLGIHRSLFDAKALWRLLLEQKAIDLRMPSRSEWDFASNPGAILVSGLRNGENLNALRELSRAKELHGVWAYTNNDLERYLSEISILWSSASEIPQINLHPRKLLRERTSKSVPLFDEKARLPFQAQLAACFPENGLKELEDAVVFLEQLNEHGLLLVASDCFWPTDTGEAAQRLRESSLRMSSVRLIVDLRQLTGTGGEQIPKGLCVLERCSSKELRDSSRPQILRLRGQLARSQAQTAWAMVLETLQQENTPGEVTVKTLPSAGESLKLETMSAAACQQQLKSTPWVTLSDPYFYELSGRLRRLPSRAFTLGSVLRWKPGISMPAQRSVLLQERDGKTLQADLASEPASSDETKRFLFVPDSSLVESPLFISAQVHSSPVQFWFRLELEQSLNGKAAKSKQPERQSEQRLKLMPLVRLFEPGTLLPVAMEARQFASIDEARSILSRALRGNLGMVERQQLHQVALSLEHSIRQHVEVCREFTRHLFPELDIQRWNLPVSLPDIAPTVAFEIFRHLDKSPILHHPSLHVTKLRPAHDFKVTNAALNELPAGLAELQVFHGMDAVLRLSGPALILRAAAADLQLRTGRPWSECAERLKFPTDFALVQTQIREVLRSIHHQLQVTRECIAVLDQLFCCLFGLAANFEDDRARQTIRHHLSPEEGKIVVSFQKPQAIQVQAKREGFESPTGFLQ